jgi:hypothetical protein
MRLAGTTSVTTLTNPFLVWRNLLYCVARHFGWLPSVKAPSAEWLELSESNGKPYRNDAD